MMVSYAMPSEDKSVDVKHIQLSLPTLPYTVTSLDSLNLFTIVHVIVGERPKFFVIFLCKMRFLISLMKFGTK